MVVGSSMATGCCSWTSLQLAEHGTEVRWGVGLVDRLQGLLSMTHFSSALLHKVPRLLETGCQLASKRSVTGAYEHSYSREGMGALLFISHLSYWG